MQINHLKPVFIGFLFLCSFQSFCQNGITSGGGTLMTDDGILSYSIGQVSYQIISGAQSELSQGVQQAFEISVVSNSESIENEPKVSIFPNPTSDFVTIQFENIPNNQSRLELKDASGKLIYSKTNLSKSSQIPFYSLSSGVYFLSLNSADSSIQSFKIVKNR